ncbi:neutral cholesterol ester hydrolase 1-like isoform X2 [Amphiura filiformis]|uniref:neutral cholesterol ester hydrolase 1-like isoform X2 n=1 Tax=Amphiura filiformis TaxID=82378 RepID=UPI003B21D9F6
MRLNVVSYRIAGLFGQNLFDVLAKRYGPSDRKITNTQFDGVPVRIYEPPKTADSQQPAVFYMHGGGFRCLSVDTLHPFTDDLATKLDIVVISIDYRLSTEALFPAAIDDCTKAVVWFLNHTKDYNVDSTKVIIMGESAGGNLAAGVTQRITLDPMYQHVPKLRAHILICPMLQAMDFNTPAYQQYGEYETALLQKEVVVASWVEYLTGSAQLQEVFATNMHTSPAAKKSDLFQKVLSHDNIPERFKIPPYVAPSSTDFGDEDLYETLKTQLLDPSFAPLMRDGSLKGIPEAYIVTCTYDVLRDDGIFYVKRLEAAGVKVTWVHNDDGIHAMSIYSATGPFAVKAGVRSRQKLFAFIENTLKT